MEGIALNEFHKVVGDPSNWTPSPSSASEAAGEYIGIEAAYSGQQIAVKQGVEAGVGAAMWKRMIHPRRKTSVIAEKTGSSNSSVVST